VTKPLDMMVRLYDSEREVPSLMQQNNSVSLNIVKVLSITVVYWEVMNPHLASLRKRACGL